MDDATRQKLIAELGNVMQLFDKAIEEEKAEAHEKQGDSAPKAEDAVEGGKSHMPALVEGQKQIRALMTKLG